MELPKMRMRQPAKCANLLKLPHQKRKFDICSLPARYPGLHSSFTVYSRAIQCDWVLAVHEECACCSSGVRYVHERGQACAAWEEPEDAGETELDMRELPMSQLYRGGLQALFAYSPVLAI